MSLIFANPDDNTEPLFDRFQAAAAGHLARGRVTIFGHDDLFTVHVNDWTHVGTPDEIVAAFRECLGRLPLRFEKYQSKPDGKWCVVTLPHDWPPNDLHYTDLLPAPNQTDRWFDSESEADAEIL